jgi:hypothetical protein
MSCFVGCAGLCECLQAAADVENGGQLRQQHGGEERCVLRLGCCRAEEHQQQREVDDAQVGPLEQPVHAASSSMHYSPTHTCLCL